MKGLILDIRYGLRTLAKNPAFTAIAVIILALGIGANTALFSVVTAVLLKDLPYKDPDTLILCWGIERGSEKQRGQVSATDIADLRSGNTVFEDISTYTDWRPILSGGEGDAERIPAIQVGDGFFRIMRAEPLLGRLFLPEDQTEGRDYVVVLSNELWRHRFSQDQRIIGKTIRLNLKSYTVVGVLKPDFSSLPTSLIDAAAELYRPVAEPYDPQERSSRHLRAIARLKPGKTLEYAQSEISTIAARLEREYPDDNTGRGMKLTTITEDTVGDFRTPLWMLTSAAMLVLFIACFNIANLLLARASSRHREIAIRTSLGASRWRLVRQLFVESSLVAVLGTILGILITYWCVDAIKVFAVNLVPYLEYASVRASALLFALCLTILSVLLFGTAPAFHVLKRISLNDSLKEGSQRSGGSASFKRTRSGLIVAEVALALLLLTGAGLLIQSVARLLHVNPGFDSRNVLTMNVWLPYAKYENKESRTLFLQGMLDRLQSISGVEAAGTTTVLPLSSNFDGRSIAVDGQPVDPAEAPDADMYVVSPGYLEAMKIPVIRGRSFTRQDSESALHVALVNETMARKIWPTEDPIGKRIRRFPNAKDPTPWHTVVGIVQDVKQYGLDANVPMQFYFPQAQYHALYVSLVIRYSGNPVSLVSAIRKEILNMDPELPVFDIATIEELRGNSVSTRKLTMMLLCIFAFLALSLAAAGIYGVVTYSTTQRTQEIAIRMALGARQRDAVYLVVREGVRPALIGAVLGMLSAFFLTGYLSKLLFQVSPSDPITLSGVTILLVAVAMLACYVPARKAAKVDPIISLRYE